MSLKHDYKRVVMVEVVTCNIPNCQIDFESIAIESLGAVPQLFRA